MADTLEQIAATAQSVVTSSKKRTPPPTLLATLDFIAQLAENQKSIVVILQGHINDKGEHWK